MATTDGWTLTALSDPEPGRREPRPQPQLAGGPGDPRRGAFRGALALTLGADVIALTTVATLLLRPAGTVQVLATVIATAVVGTAALATRRLYRSHIVATCSLEASRILQATALLIVVAALLQPWPLTERPEGLVQLWLLTVGALLLGRGVVRAVLRGQRRRGTRAIPVVLVGDGQEGRRLIALCQDHPDAGFRVVAASGPQDGWEDVDVAWLGEDPVEVARRTGATGAIIEAAGIDPSVVHRWIAELQAADLHVMVATGLRGLDHHRVVHRPLVHEPLVYVQPPRLGPGQRRAKWALDLVIAPLALLAVAPILLVAAVAIKLDGPGPVLFRQQRVGQGGVPFELLKLRTMGLDAEARRAELESANERTGPLFKLQTDPRVTRVGRLLRASSIDELPQLANVLRGHMSLVGPRPALPSEVAAFDAELRRRAELKPGITGLWQIEARDCPSFAAYRRLDLFYVTNWSIGLDLVILARTVPAVLSKGLEGIRHRFPGGRPSPALE